MAGFYESMAAMAQDLLKPDAAGGLGQGTVALKRIIVTPPLNDWEEPATSTETWTLRAAVRRVHQRYENGVLIVETGDVVIFAVPPVVPALTDLLVIDGRDRVIDSLTPIPGAGTVSAWKAWSKA